MKSTAPTTTACHNELCVKSVIGTRQSKGTVPEEAITNEPFQAGLNILHTRQILHPV